VIIDDQDVRRTLHFGNIDEGARPVLRNVCPAMATAASDKLCHKKPSF
jgi:hypothetical protein